MKKLNNLEKSKVRGGWSALGIIQGSVAMLYTLGEVFNLISSWIHGKKNNSNPTQQPKNFINKNDSEQITIFS